MVHLRQVDSPDWLINIARTPLTHKNIALYFFLCSTNQFISFTLNTQGEPPIWVDHLYRDLFATSRDKIYLISWSRQPFTIRISTQMGGSPCVFNAKEMNWLVEHKKKYNAIFLWVNRVRAILINQSGNASSTYSRVTSKPVGNKSPRYLIIWAMNSDTWYSQRCRWVILERNMPWL